MSNFQEAERLHPVVSLFDTGDNWQVSISLDARRTHRRFAVSMHLTLRLHTTTDQPFFIHLAIIQSMQFSVVS